MKYVADVPGHQFRSISLSRHHSASLFSIHANSDEVISLYRPFQAEKMQAINTAPQKESHEVRQAPSPRANCSQKVLDAIYGKPVDKQAEYENSLKR